MSIIAVEGQAKINLTLDILGVRADGYHEIETVMQSISLIDKIELEAIAEPKIELQLLGKVDELGSDESNLAYRAAKLLLSVCAVNGGVRIKLTKGIPIAAGLAGGSTDAAAVLRGMNRLYNLGLSTDKLCELGVRIGSDIPFCIEGGTVLAKGRGELLEQLPSFPKTYVVLAKPPVAVSTAWAYTAYDKRSNNIKHPDTKELIKSIRAGDRIQAIKYFGNVLEPITSESHTIINKYKELFNQAVGEGRTLTVMMSGSGPTVFAMYETEAEAERAAAYMRNNIVGDVYVARTT